jgi:hypothetical protein
VSGLKSKGPYRCDMKQDKRIVRQLRRDPDTWAAQLWKLRADTRSTGGAASPNKISNTAYGAAVAPTGGGSG